MLKQISFAASLLFSTAVLAQGAAPAAPAKPATPAAPAKPAEAAKPATPATPAKPATPATPATPAAGAAAAAPEMPKPAAEMAGLKPYEGNWKCEGTLGGGTMGPEVKYKAKMTGKSDLGGFFTNVRWEQQKSKDVPNPFVAQIFAGYDPSKKVFTRSDVSNMGGVVHLSAPAAWDGDKHVWTGEAMGPMGKQAVRHTFTKTGDKTMTALFEMQGKDGAWAKWDMATCKK